MPKDRDNDERRDSELAIAVCALTCELAEHRKLKMEALEFLKSRLATKCDVQEAKLEILKAINGEGGIWAGVAKATEDLSASTDALQNAVNKNK